MNGMVNNTGAGTREALIEAFDMALSAVTPLDGRGFFELRGCRMTVQSLSPAL